MLNFRRFVGLFGLFFLIILGCQNAEKPIAKTNNKSNTETQMESRLVLNNATLEQSNAQGQTLWKIQVKEAVYSKDRQLAQLKNIKGNILQDGKIVLRVSAKNGEIYKGGEEIFLKDKIVAVDPRNGTVIQSDEVEWKPKDSVLIVRKNFRGSHPKLQVKAKEGRYYTKQQRLELVQDIVATTQNPNLQLKGEQIVWEVSQQKVLSDRPLQINRYQDKTITDQVDTHRVSVDLKAQTIFMFDNVEFKSLDPPLQIVSKSVFWQYKERLLKADNPVKLVHNQQKLTITGNRAEVDLAQKVARLREGVQAISDRNQTKLYSNELIWKMTPRIVEAVGNVVYEQTNPKFNLTGDKAVGSLQNNSVVVSSNSKDRVVTEIFPQ
jgi:LPS export ABC transporter protein LptC